MLSNCDNKAIDTSFTNGAKEVYENEIKKCFIVRAFAFKSVEAKNLFVVWKPTTF